MQIELTLKNNIDAQEAGKLFHVPAGAKFAFDIPEASGIAGTMEDAAAHLENGAEVDAKVTLEWVGNGGVEIKFTAAEDIPNFAHANQEKDIAAHVGDLIENFLIALLPEGIAVDVSAKLVA